MGAVKTGPFSRLAQIRKRCSRWKRRPLGLRKNVPQKMGPLGLGAKARFIKILSPPGSAPAKAGLPGTPLVDMCYTCNYPKHMSKMIQVRNVPDALHRTLKARAAMAGMSLSDYLLAEIREIAERPTLEEMRERLRRYERVTLSTPAAQVIREARDNR